VSNNDYTSRNVCNVPSVRQIVFIYIHFLGNLTSDIISTQPLHSTSAMIYLFIITFTQNFSSIYTVYVNNTDNVRITQQ
jgi:hypothetical protein